MLVFSILVAQRLRCWAMDRKAVSLNFEAATAGPLRKTPYPQLHKIDGSCFREVFLPNAINVHA